MILKTSTSWLSTGFRWFSRIGNQDKKGKGYFDMPHLLPLSKWKSSPQPVREEFSESESDSCSEEDSDDEKPIVIPRRRKKIVPKRSDSKIKFQRIPKRNQASRKRKAPPPPPRAPPPQPFPRAPPKPKVPKRPRLKPSLFPSKQN